MYKILFVLIAATMMPSMVMAADDALCEKGLICASDPATVATAMQEEGYRAKLGKDALGDPMIESEASGYDFEVLFYDCEDGKACKALQFSAGFKPEKEYSAEYANSWNSSKRYVRAYVNDKKELFLRIDMTTAGGLNKANFADSIDWWVTMLGEFSKFAEEQKAANK